MRSLKESWACTTPAPTHGCRPSSPAPASTSFDPAELRRLLEPDHPELRARLLGVLQRPDFALGRDETTSAYRARVRQWCKV